jgi:hypothetical protein
VGAGTMVATGGTLDVTSNINGGTNSFQVASGSTLKFDGTVAAGEKVTFLASSGTLQINDGNSISGGIYDGFAGTVVDLIAGSSTTTPTNAVDFAQLPTADITSATLNTTTDVVTVNTTGVSGGSSFTMQLTGTYAAGTTVNFAGDGAVGTDLFLSATPPNFASYVFTAQGATDSWLDLTSWGALGAPPVGPGIGDSVSFFNNGTGANTIFIPATLQQATGQATGGGTTTWTINETDSNPFTSSLTLVNQGQIFVNATNNYTQASSGTRWTLTSNGQYFENDGSVNIIGPIGGTSTATFSGNTSITGSGQINLFGNSSVVLANGVAVSGGQTINFDTSSGSVIEGGGVADATRIGGFLTGDTVTVENLGATPTGRSECRPEPIKLGRSRQHRGEQYSV